MPWRYVTWHMPGPCSIYTRSALLIRVLQADNPGLSSYQHVETLTCHRAPTVRIPRSSLDLKKDQSSAISLVATVARASEPLPAEIAQRDEQYLLWTTNSTYVPSWYPTTVERIKVRYVHFCSVSSAARMPACRS